MPVRNRTDEDFFPASLPPYLPDSFRRQEAAAMAETLPPKYRPESTKSIVKRPLTSESAFEDGSFVPVNTLAQAARNPLSTNGTVVDNVLPSRPTASTLHGVTTHSRNRYVPSLESNDGGFDRAALPPYLPDSFRRQESSDIAEALPPKYRPESTKSIAKRLLTTDSTLANDSDLSHSPNSESVFESFGASPQSEQKQPVSIGQTAKLDRDSILPISPNSESVFVAVSVPVQSDPIQVTPVGHEAERVLPSIPKTSSNAATIAQIPRRHAGDVAFSLGQAVSAASLPAYLPDSFRGQENDAGRPPPKYHPDGMKSFTNRPVTVECVNDDDYSNPAYSSGSASLQAATNVIPVSSESAHAPAYADPERPVTGIRPEHVHPSMIPSSNSPPPTMSQIPSRYAGDVAPSLNQTGVSGRSLPPCLPDSFREHENEAGSLPPKFDPEVAKSSRRPVTMESVLEEDSDSTYSSSLASRQAAPNGDHVSGISAHALASTLARPGTGIRPEQVHPTMLPSNNPSPPTMSSQFHSRYADDVVPSAPPPYLPEAVRQRNPLATGL